MDDSWKLTLSVFDWQSMDSNHLDRKKAWLQKKIVHLSYSHFLSISLSYSLNFSLSVSHSLHAVVFQPQVPPWQFQTAEAQQVYSLAAWPPLTPTSNTNTDIYKYKTKYDRNTPLNRKACRDAFKREKAKTFIGHLNGVLLDTDIVFQDDSIILTSNDCQQSS